MSESFDESLQALLSEGSEFEAWDPLEEVAYGRLIDLAEVANLPRPDASICDTDMSWSSWEEFSDRVETGNRDQLSDAYFALVSAATIETGLITDDGSPHDNSMVAELRDKAITLAFTAPGTTEDKIGFVLMADKYFEGKLTPVAEGKENSEVIEIVKAIVLDCTERVKQKNSNTALAEVMQQTLSVIYKTRRGYHDDLEAMMNQFVRSAIALLELADSGKSTEEIAGFMRGVFGSSRRFKQLESYLGASFDQAVQLSGVIAKRLSAYGYRPLSTYVSKSISR